jgi:hypothetical protein
MDKDIKPCGYGALGGYTEFFIICPPYRGGLACNKVFLGNKRKFELAVFKDSPPQKVDGCLIH